MTTQTESLDIRHYPPAVQGRGAFDGGRITEHKLVGFPHEGPRVPHLGPLFYWAWAAARGYGKIGLHPHRAFEIMSYALEGEIGHFDSLGCRSRVAGGGAQIMQAGSGISHAEETLSGGRTEFFQIWFEPALEEAMTRAPRYHDIQPEDFPRQTRDGVALKTLIGDGAPVALETEAAMHDASLSGGRNLDRCLGEGRTLATAVVSGRGRLARGNGETLPLAGGDFVVTHARQRARVEFQADAERALRLVLIEVLARVDYPLYRDRL
ncbi:MAG: pirin family protein [Nitrospinaceae bacterium]|jgi:redox-sensitive bicupin YhaK (pirin superfamily)|nr:MAG: pirin family protein [Nitrospinaceae bacterium]